MRVKSFPLRTLSLAVALSIPMVAAHAGATGNIGVYSKYILRGVTDTNGTATQAATASENDNGVLQGGFDYSADNGLYAGYWGSTLGYSYTESAGFGSASGFENDLYAGWAGKSGDFSYSLGFVQYYYMNVADSNLTEFTPTIGYGPVTLGVKYLLSDGMWGNQGDAYWTASYSTDLPSNFKLGAVAGYYTYEKSDNSELCLANTGTKVSDCGFTTEGSAFRHVDLTLSHPIANTGADMSVTYTLAGKNRQGLDMTDAVWFGVKYGFDL